MASNFGISGDPSAFFSGYLGTSGSSKSNGMNTMLGDYAMIRSGSYKKLLNAYYKKENNKGTNTEETKETEADKANKLALTQTKSAAAELRKAAEELKETDFTNKESAQAKIKSFVDAYNTTLDSADDVDTSSILHKTLWMIGSTKESSNLLNEVGIRVGKNNKLTIDNDRLKNADVTTLNTLFKGRGSLADKVSSKAWELKNLSNTALNTEKNGNAYTKKGDYTSMNTNSIYNNLF
ncbi:MAG: hypothetical protein RSB37_08220 [Acetivibrio sp.]